MCVMNDSRNLKVTWKLLRLGVQIKYACQMSPYVASIKAHHALHGDT